jgi:DNA-binding transcriptional LysR family regulator
MTQAAEQLNFTQPAITGQIHALEQDFGVMLFDRVGKKLFITEAGRELIGYAEKLLAIYDEGRKALSAHPGHIKIGIDTTTVNYFLAPYLQAFKERMPLCSLTLEMCSSAAVVPKGLAENRFDLGIIQKEMSLDYLTGFEMFKEQLVWVVHPRLAEKHNNSMDIMDYPLLEYKIGGLFRSLYEKVLGDARDKNGPSIVYNDSEAMKNSILQGLGCGALPLNMARKLLEDGSLIEFTNFQRPDFSVWVVYHKEKKLSQAALNLIKILKGEEGGLTE